MSNEIRVGVAGLTHGHVGGLISSWQKMEGARLVAVADKTQLLDSIEGFDRKYVDYREMLDKEQLDALVVTSDNRESTEITIEALGRGIPCMVEKAMAADAADADRMLDAMRKSGKTLMINWPLAWNPWLYDFKKRIDAGEIGDVFHLRYRNGHYGPKEIGCGAEFVAWLHDAHLNGGGAIADFGSYGAAVAIYLLGMPESVYCVRGNFTKGYEVSDDHAVLVLKYPKGSAILEGTWATYGMDSGPNAVVHGKTGTLAAFGDRVEKTAGWNNVTSTNPTYLLGPSPAEYFWNAVTTNRTPEGILDPAVAADACRILDAAIKSSESGCAERPSKPR